MQSDTGGWPSITQCDPMTEPVGMAWCSVFAWFCQVIQICLWFPSFCHRYFVTDILGEELLEVRSCVVKHTILVTGGSQAPTSVNRTEPGHLPLHCWKIVLYTEPVFSNCCIVVASMTVLNYNLRSNANESIAVITGLVGFNGGR